MYDILLTPETFQLARLLLKLSAPMKAPFRLVVSVRLGESMAVMARLSALQK